LGSRAELTDNVEAAQAFVRALVRRGEAAMALQQVDDASAVNKMIVDGSIAVIARRLRSGGRPIADMKAITMKPEEQHAFATAAPTLRMPRSRLYNPWTDASNRGIADTRFRLWTGDGAIPLASAP
jgi:hypothetical protein